MILRRLSVPIHVDQTAFGPDLKVLQPRYFLTKSEHFAKNWELALKEAFAKAQAGETSRGQRCYQTP